MVSPFSLTTGTTIMAKIRAKNSFGWGDYSDFGSGPKVAPVPTSAP